MITHCGLRNLTCKRNTRERGRLRTEVQGRPVQGRVRGALRSPPRDVRGDGAGPWVRSRSSANKRKRWPAPGGGQTMRLREGPSAGRAPKSPRRAACTNSAPRLPDRTAQTYTAVMRRVLPNASSTGRALFGLCLLCPEPTVQEALLRANVLKTQWSAGGNGGRKGLRSALQGGRALPHGSGPDHCGSTRNEGQMFYTDFGDLANKVAG